jgi:hypothetical protein
MNFDLHDAEAAAAFMKAISWINYDSTGIRLPASPRLKPRPAEYPEGYYELMDRAFGTNG